MVFQRTLGQISASLTDLSVALVFSVTIAVGCAVRQDLMVGTRVAVIVFIVGVVVFFKEPLFCHGSFVGKDRQDAIGEDFLMVAFVKPSTVRIRLASFNGFCLGLRCRTASGIGVIIIIFQGFFS